MNEKLTSTTFHEILLEEFAALTRHKPAAIASLFSTAMSAPTRPGDTLLRLVANFAGRRSAAMPVPWDVTSWDGERFRQEVAKPLARKLLESA